MRTEFAKHSKECAETYNITPEQITELRTAKDNSSFQPSQNFKTFVRCISIKTGSVVIETGVINVDRIVQIGVSQGIDEAVFRTKVEKCKPTYSGSYTPDDAWTMYSCIYSK